jgi:pSer/pThr/pTyr-binding forkhead associated (FHA) protein
LSTTTSSDPLARHSLSAAELSEMLAAERSGGAFLAMRDGAGSLRLLALDRHAPDAPAVTIGRDAGMDVPITWDAEVSVVHAELRRLGEEWTVLDDGLSRNGTFLNGKRITSRQRLRPGDRLMVGRTIIAYCRQAGRTAEPTVASIELPEPPRLSESQRRVLIALCRPYLQRAPVPVPATNQQIAQEVFLGVDAVKRHLRVLFQCFGLGELPQNHKRASLAEIALRLGIVSERDLSGR